MNATKAHEDTAIGKGVDEHIRRMHDNISHETGM
jgi:hypothetical protein